MLNVTLLPGRNGGVAIDELSAPVEVSGVVVVEEPVVAFAVVQCRVVAKAGDRAVWPEREWNEISAYTVNPDGCGDLIPAQDKGLLGVERTPSGSVVVPSRIEAAAKARGVST